MNLKSISVPVLSYLSEEHFITIEELCHQLSLSRIVIEKQIKQLQKLGYELALDDQKGYRIISRPDILLPFEIQNRLTTCYIGHTIYYFPELSSTNIVARQKLIEKKDKMPEGTIIVAEKQSGGKGRLGKRWYSPQGGIWLSTIFYPEIALSHISLITPMTAVAVARTIHKLFPHIGVEIKWPNDLLIDNRKVCGILTEVSTEAQKMKWIIVGIGINANNDSTKLPEDIRKYSISLTESTGQLIPRATFVCYLCSELENWYEKLKKKEFLPILKEWKLYNNIIGKKVIVDTGGKIITGEALNLNERGALILKTDKGETREIISGTILKEKSIWEDYQ